MNQRIYASISPVRPRRGFTLIELLVVMAVIAILLSLTAAGVMAWVNGNARNVTEAEIRGLHAILMQHWSAVVESAKKERLWNSDPVASGGDNSTLLATADNDTERARILMIKIRLIEAFPVNFSEVPPTGQDRYATVPLSMIPVKKRRQAYSQGYQSLIYNGSAPRWNNGTTSTLLLGKESVESAVCLWAALSVAKEGINVENDQLQAWMKDVDGSGNKVLADAWATPLRFYRFSTDNIDLNSLAPVGIVTPAAVDPLDVNGKLMNWYLPNSTTAISPNATFFDQRIHKRIYQFVATGKQVAQYAVPVIVSAGPDGKFGLKAPDTNTKTFPIGSTATSIPPTSILPAQTTPYVYYQDMSAQVNKDELDNIYSFKKPNS